MRAQITRLNTENPNMSQTVIHSDTVYLAGQVPNDYSAGIMQTEETLAKVDALLEVRVTSPNHPHSLTSSTRGLSIRGAWS